MERSRGRQGIAELVVKIIQGWHFDNQITEDTDFLIDIPIDKKTKGLYYYAIRLNLEKLGYVFCNFSAEDCEQAETIRDIVDAVWDDVNPESKRTM